MAISPTQRYLFRSLVDNKLLPQGVALLEIGEANWYGAVETSELLELLDEYVKDEGRRVALRARIDKLLLTQPVEMVLFDAVKILYDILFAPKLIDAIDMGGTELARRLDLNQPISLGRQFDLVINHGTAEHVFNIGQVFHTIHDHTAPGGMMLHESPFTGWIDHGFYSLQPTLFYDLAHANSYGLMGLFVQDLSKNTLVQIRERDDVYRLAQAKEFPENSMLSVVLRKNQQERPFRMPLQGYYSGKLSEEGVKAWEGLR
jgi:hypothetical protein